MLKTIAIAAALLAAPAVAHASDEVPSYTVKTGDLALTTEAGIARLDARIEYAAKSMCFTGGRDSQSLRAEAACRKDVIDSNAAAARLAVAKANARKFRVAATPSSQPGA